MTSTLFTIGQDRVNSLAAFCIKRACDNKAIVNSMDEIVIRTTPWREELFLLIGFRVYYIDI